MSKLTLLILLACCLRAPAKIYAQENTLLFESYNSEKGLSQNSGYAITQDRQGFIWVGTQDGLNRFDGAGFKVYRNDPKLPASIPFNDISALLTDSKGNLWIGSPTGIAIYHSETDRFNYLGAFFQTSPEADKLAINKIYEDRSQKIWLLTRYNGLYLFDPLTRKLSHYLFEKLIREKLTGITEDDHNLYVSSVDELFQFDNEFSFQPMKWKENNKIEPDVMISDIAALNQKLWIGTLQHGIYLLNKSGNHYEMSKRLLPGPGSLSSNAIKCLRKDQHNNMWIGTRNGGLCEYISASGKFIRGVHSFFINNSLNKNFVLSIYEDRQGIIWAGLSGGGLAKYDPDKFQFQTYRQQPGETNTLSDNMIFCIYGKNDHEVFIGTQNGGLSIFNETTETYTSCINDPKNSKSLVNNTVYGLAKEDDDHFWLATWGGLCLYQPSLSAEKAFTSFASNTLTDNLYSVIKLQRQAALLASGSNGLFRFDLTDKKWTPLHDEQGFLENHSIVARYFQETANGNIWMGTEGMGLLHYNYLSGIFEETPAVYAISTNVRYIFPENNILWLATDNGLIRYDVSEKKVTGVWNAKNGLPNDVAYAIQKDQSGNLWISTNNGLSCFQLQKNVFKNYDVNYGLQGMEFNTAACYADNKGNIYFGGINGLNVFNPLHLSVNQFAPSVHITAVKLFDKELTTLNNINFTETIELNYQQNFLTFEFTALNYSHTEKNSYFYLLEGVDEHWIDAGKRNFAAYTQLVPGSYTFNLKATNSDGIPSREVKRLKVIIHPPFWSTWWFRMILVLLSAAIIAGLYFFKIDQIRKQERLKADFNKKLADAEKAALRAQMNPHFIFNTLNSINSYIIENKTRVASDYLTKFARLIRIILDNSKNESISLSKEIETLKLYLLMESVRFDNRFDYEIRIEDLLDEEGIKIPPMVIQPYVENAIWHGLLHKEEKGKAIISISKKETDVLQVSITDNGIGRQKAAEMKSKDSNKNKSYGMKITKDRLMMSNENNRVEMIDLVDEEGNAAGTTVILSITF
ncbi:MAG: two-component regulator propeller domain-containing protein [Flavitalea sp.]